MLKMIKRILRRVERKKRQPLSPTFRTVLAYHIEGATPKQNDKYY